MPTHTKAPASASIPSYSALIRRALPLWLLVMVVLVLYWAQLLQAHRDQLAQVEAQTRLRATQMASALSLQIGSLFNGVDYVSRTLANTYRDDQPEVFRQALDLASYPLPWLSEDCPVYMSWHKSSGQDTGLNWLKDQVRAVSSF